jgi:hypothetical protein
MKIPYLGVFGYVFSYSATTLILAISETFCSKSKISHQSETQNPA